MKAVRLLESAHHFPPYHIFFKQQFAESFADCCLSLRRFITPYCFVRYSRRASEYVFKSYKIAFRNLFGKFYRDFEFVESLAVILLFDVI